MRYLLDRLERRTRPPSTLTTKYRNTAVHGPWNLGIRLFAQAPCSPLFKHLPAHFSSDIRLQLLPLPSEWQTPRSSSVARGLRRLRRSCSRRSRHLLLTWLLPTRQSAERRRARRHGVHPAVRRVRCLWQVEEDLPVALPLLFLREARVRVRRRPCLLQLDVRLAIGVAGGPLGFGWYARPDGVGEVDDEENTGAVSVKYSSKASFELTA